MTASEVLRLVAVLDRSRVRTWLDGGWGVDALLSEQTRTHDDLDLVVELADVPKLQDALEREGYELLGGEPPMSFEMVDPVGRQVDVHPVVFDQVGNGVYRMRSGESWTYPAAGFAGTGVIEGRSVTCLSAEVQMLCHTGYELSEKDHEEINALHERLGVAPPPGYEPPAREN